MEPSDIPLPPQLPGFQDLVFLGQGGMGEVYRARQISLDRIVAVKFLTLRPGIDQDEQVKRFRREAALMARIQNPHIVAVYEHGESDGRPYLVMEYVDGHDLRHFMEEGRPVAMDRVRQLVRPLILALRCLHDYGVLHRDLKPENILIGANFTPKVTDFGIALEQTGDTRLTSFESWVGTPGYVAPEVQYRLKVDSRADQYSMAAVVYELLTGHKALGVLQAPSQSNPAISDEVDEVVLRGMKEDRDDRYATIGEFGDALEQALAVKPSNHFKQRFLTRKAARWAVVLPLLAIAVILLGSLGQPSTWTNSLGMELVWVPRGEFEMGTEGPSGAIRPEEAPRHHVRFSRPFSMSTHEVTVGQFREFVKATHYQTEAEKSGRGGHVFDPAANLAGRDAKHTWHHPRGDRPAADDEPVTQVTWNDAVAFCRWLADLEGRPYRLPTEAEWEYACRAGTTTPWFPGSDLEVLDHFAWTHRNSSALRPVGGRHPNRFGLYDMHGNVWEWCQDAYHSYTASPLSDPAAVVVGRDHVLRGGSWNWPEIGGTRSAARLDAPADYADFTYGFRVVVEDRRRP